VKDILEHLGKKEKEGNNRHGPRSPADLRDLIAEYCISIYERKYNLKDLKPMVKSGTKSDQSSGIKQNRNSTSTPGKNDVTGRTQVKSDADKQQQQQQQHNAEEEEEERERSIRQIFSDAINEIVRHTALDNMLHAYSINRAGLNQNYSVLSVIDSQVKKDRKVATGLLLGNALSIGYPSLRSDTHATKMRRG
jgi:hypothetical protein